MYLQCPYPTCKQIHHCTLPPVTLFLAPPPLHTFLLTSCVWRHMHVSYSSIEEFLSTTLYIYSCSCAYITILPSHSFPNSPLTVSHPKLHHLLPPPSLPPSLSPSVHVHVCMHESKQFHTEEQNSLLFTPL